MASSKLSIFKVKLQCDTSWDSIIGSVLQMDSEDLHCVVNEQSKDYIGGYYLISVTQNQKIYNFKADKFETITVKKQNVVKFDIFIHLGKMLLWGSKRSADILITAFLQAANNQLVVDSSKIEYIQILNNLLTMKDIRFSRMRITDVLIRIADIFLCGNARLVGVRHQKPSRLQQRLQINTEEGLFALYIQKNHQFLSCLRCVTKV